MPSSTVRRITPKVSRNFGKIHDEFPVPDLTEIQTRSYKRFLQADIPAESRLDAGLEGVFREIFPIESYDKTLKLEYLRYDLGKPRYDPDECRQLRLTFGRPLHVWLRLNKGETTLEESVYLGDMPVMIGGGEFIINGAERVVVSQLHRSPGVDFVVEIESTDKKLHACRVIPERGSWIELQVTKKETLGVRIDQSGKFSSMTLLRAMSPAFSSDEAILEAFYDSEVVKSNDPKAATLLDLSNVYMTFFLPTDTAGNLALGAEARILLDAVPDIAIPAMVTFVAPRAQFTPKQVETKSERDRMMFRVKARVPEALVTRYIERVKTGLTGMAYVKLDDKAVWPDWLESKLTREATSSPGNTPSPPRGEGRGEGDAPHDFAENQSLSAPQSTPRIPLTLTLSPGGRGDIPAGERS